MLDTLGQATGLPTLTLIAVPLSESPVQHLRNALQLLSLLQEMSPAVWALNPELGRAQRRADAGRTILEHHGPEWCAACHIERAIEALLAAQLDWTVIEIIPAAMARLFAAWFPLRKNAEEN
jgi:hypothetical protein